jgi:putative zinc finger/helix-turn-helix YgiT family protein
MTHDTATNKSRKRHDRPFPWPCVNCLKDEVYPETISYTAKVKHDGRLHEIHLPELTIPKCRACGELVFSNSADDQILMALRLHLRLLTPQEIKAGRKALRLKSKELAERLGIAAATISRWEKGHLIQSRAMDNLLRLFFNSSEVRALLGQRWNAADVQSHAIGTRPPDEARFPGLEKTPELAAAEQRFRDRRGAVAVPDPNAAAARTPILAESTTEGK